MIRRLFLFFTRKSIAQKQTEIAAQIAASRENAKPVWKDIDRKNSEEHLARKKSAKKSKNIDRKNFEQDLARKKSATKSKWTNRLELSPTEYSLNYISEIAENEQGVESVKQGLGYLIAKSLSGTRIARGKEFDMGSITMDSRWRGLGFKVEHAPDGPIRQFTLVRIKDKAYAKYHNAK